MDSIQCPRSDWDEDSGNIKQSKEEFWRGEDDEYIADMWVMGKKEKKIERKKLSSDFGGRCDTEGHQLIIDIKGWEDWISTVRAMSTERRRPSDRPALASAPSDPATVRAGKPRRLRVHVARESTVV